VNNEKSKVKNDMLRKVLFSLHVDFVMYSFWAFSLHDGWFMGSFSPLFTHDKGVMSKNPDNLHMTMLS
jgi:hypothetical protein